MKFTFLEFISEYNIVELNKTILSLLIILFLQFKNRENGQQKQQEKCKEI